MQILSGHLIKSDIEQIEKNSEESYQTHYYLTKVAIDRLISSKLHTLKYKRLHGDMIFHSIPFYLNQATWPIHTHTHRIKKTLHSKT